MSPLDVPIALALVGAALLVALLLAALIVREAHTRRPVQLDDPRPLARFGQCETTGCHYPATVEAHHVNGPQWATSRRCTGCGAEGAARGWWHTRQLRADRGTVQA